MIKLQNNFTTPEQSKRLLKLGVPSDSADCYYRKYHNHIEDERFSDTTVGPDILIGTYDSFTSAVKDAEGTTYETIPCWSVGRLIEIHETCTVCLFERRNPQLSVLEDVLSQIAEDIMATDECWDFSKLKE